MNGQDFSELLKSTQRHISAVYSGAVNGNKKEQLRSYIEQYLRQSAYTDETELKALTDRLYSEMAEYSVSECKRLGRYSRPSRLHSLPQYLFCRDIL